MIEATTPLHLRVHLTHAFLQFIADREGIDLLHIKGPALHEVLLQQDGEGNSIARTSTDADVLVRPGDAGRFLAALQEAGCQMHTSFTTGSPFEHAATMWSDSLGYADIHRFFPGIDLDPGEAFQDLWARRGRVQLAHRDMWVPALEDQRLIILLHSARSGAPDNGDKQRAWDQATEAERQGVRDRARHLGASVALAAAIGELDEHRDSATYQLWDQFSRRGEHSRSEEWVARYRAARTLRAKISVVARATQVNVDRLTLELGHSPSGRELRAAYVDRFRHAVTELWDRLRRRP